MEISACSIVSRDFINYFANFFPPQTIYTSLVFLAAECLVYTPAHVEIYATGMNRYQKVHIIYKILMSYYMLLQTIIHVKYVPECERYKMVSQLSNSLTTYAHTSEQYHRNRLVPTILTTSDI